MHVSGLASPSGKIGWLISGLLVATAAVSAPWLLVKQSTQDGPAPLGGRAGISSDRASSGGKGAAQGGLPGREGSGLVLTPVPVAAGPPIAASAPALAAAVPDPASVLALEERLAALSYMMGPKNGVLDPADLAGLTAFQKVENLPRTGRPDPATLARLDSASRPQAAYNTPPEHLEVDIPRQVVFVVRGGQVSHTLPTSTGNGKVFHSQGRRSRAVTPNGQFAITYKRNGWRRSPLGLLYRPAYFNGGIAFHGAKSVPTSPASHGCVRLPMAFADWFAQEASPPGMVVYVYGNPGQPNPAPAAAVQPPPPPPHDPSAGAPPAEGDPFQPPETGPPESSPPQDSPLLGGVLGGS